MMFLPDMASLLIPDKNRGISVKGSEQGRLKIKAYVRSCDLFLSKEHSQMVGDSYRTALDSLIGDHCVNLTLAFPFRDEAEYWLDAPARAFTLGFVGGSLKDPKRVKNLITDMARKTSREHGASLFHACRVEIEGLDRERILDPDAFRTTMTVWDVYRRKL